jgi:hypothetical protein
VLCVEQRTLFPKVNGLECRICLLVKELRLSPTWKYASVMSETQEFSQPNELENESRYLPSRGSSVGIASGYGLDCRGV